MLKIERRASINLPYFRQTESEIWWNVYGEVVATDIVTLSRRTCLIVHFSALVEPQDNHVMFQVRVDGAPMEGHAIFPYSVPTVQAPVVWDPRKPTRI